MKLISEKIGIDQIKKISNLIAAVAMLSFGFSSAAEIDPNINSSGVPGSEVRVLSKVHLPYYINAVSWGPSGAKVGILADLGRRIFDYDVASGNVIQDVERYAGGYSGHSFSFIAPDSVIVTSPIGAEVGTKVQLSDKCSLIQWDLVSGKPTKFIPEYDEKTVRRLGLSSMLTDVVAINRDKGLLVWQLPPGNLVGVYSISNKEMIGYLHVGEHLEVDRRDFVTALSITADGKRIIVGVLSSSNRSIGASARVYTYDSATLTEVSSFWAYKNDSTIEDEFRVSTIDASPDGKYVATGRSLFFSAKISNDKSVDIWDLTDGRHVASLAGKFRIHDGKEEIVGVKMLKWRGGHILSAERGGIRVWDVTDLEKPELLQEWAPFSAYGQIFVSSLDYSNQDHWVASFSEGSVFVFDLGRKK